MTRRSFRIRQTIGILAVVVCGSPAGLSGQTSPEPTLDYGPHGVGFTVMEALDSTRARSSRGSADTNPRQVSRQPGSH